MKLSPSPLQVYKFVHSNRKKSTNWLARQRLGSILGASSLSVDFEFYLPACTLLYMSKCDAMLQKIGAITHESVTSKLFGKAGEMNKLPQTTRLDRLKKHCPLTWWKAGGYKLSKNRVHDHTFQCVRLLQLSFLRRQSVSNDALTFLKAKWNKQLVMRRLKVQLMHLSCLLWYMKHHWGNNNEPK